MGQKDEKYGKEMEVAVKAVHVACLLCQKVQNNLIFNDDVQAKDDNSPVTIAGNFTVLLLVSVFYIGFNIVKKCDLFMLGI